MHLEIGTIVLTLPKKPLFTTRQNKVYLSEWSGLEMAVKIGDPQFLFREYNALVTRAKFAMFKRLTFDEAALVTRWQPGRPIIKRRRGAHKSSWAWVIYDPQTDSLFTERPVLRLRESDRIDILLSLAKEIKDFHNRGIVHGDLSPGNVLVSKSNEVSLVDLGQPKRGTAGWLSPWHGQDTLGFEADVWVLGLWILRLYPESRLGKRVLRGGWDIDRIIAQLERESLKPDLSIERAKGSLLILFPIVLVMAGYLLAL